MPTAWTIQATDTGIRLDIFLTREMPETTRSQVAKRIKNGNVTVNGKAATVHRFLKKGDAVELNDAQKMDGVVGATRRVAPTEMTACIPTVPLIAETPDWLVLDKPPGLLVHPDAKTNNGTLVDFLIVHDPAIAKVGEDPSRPGIMHRLDKEASGLMVIAKTQDAFDSLKRQFAEHTVEKKYLALVFGEMEKEEGDIKFKIARSKTRQRMAARPEHEEEGKVAWTHYKVLRLFRNASLLELTILTGRTHQIRAHLLAINHPIIGDPLYKRRKEDRNISAPRLMLQAVHLGFRDPATGEKIEFDLSPDQAFNQCITALSP